MIADLHIHSRFSRACSKQITIKNLEKWARVKGLDLLGTGDFTHEKWFEELNKLEESDGVLKSESGFNFLWQTEISLMYSQGGKGRRIHYVLLAPDKDVVEQITEFLKSKGRIDYDGRPIFGFSSIELVESLMSISKEIEIIPAHCMTPWFGIFGSKTGFDSLKECFQEKVKYIHVVESGISADPEMLWNFSFLNDKSVVSFSDLHSFWPWRIGREATIFDCDFGYKNIINCIRENKGVSTIETEPAYGKYHWDGHRECGFSCSPAETKKLKGICPKCEKPLTIGVDYRVDELADQEAENYPNKNKFYKLIPLHELIAVVLGVKQVNGKRVWGVYDKLLKFYKNEFDILLNVSREDLRKVVDDKLVDLIMQNRQSKLKIQPGYDGVYGKLLNEQKGLGDY